MMVYQIPSFSLSVRSFLHSLSSFARSVILFRRSLIGCSPPLHKKRGFELPVADAESEEKVALDDDFPYLFVF